MRVCSVCGNMKFVLSFSGYGDDMCHDCAMKHICACCGKFIDDVGDMYSIDNNLLCFDCFDSKYTYCEYCSKHVLRGDIMIVEYEQELCIKCFSKYYYTCRTCGYFQCIKDAFDTSCRLCNYCLNCNGERECNDVTNAGTAYQ